ncbi:hypothetical protein J2X67_002480 [Variovorax sp. 3319]|nr:hypothetical protein [Variovorax sp. 3319]
MANLSSQQQMAPAQLAAQLRVTPSQKAQLRAVVASNAQMLEQLNQGASR